MLQTKDYKREGSGGGLTLKVLLIGPKILLIGLKILLLGLIVGGLGTSRPTFAQESGQKTFSSPAACSRFSSLPSGAFPSR